MRLISRTLIIGACAILSAQAWADAEIVIAIRYLQAHGASHSHLYLYREDGKLLRQWTDDHSGQDVDPIFSPDGDTIVFTREKPNNVLEFWGIDPRGGNLEKLDAAPDWYAQGKSSPYFTTTEPQKSASAPAYKSPDNSVELLLREDPTDEADQINGPGHGKHYLLRDLKNGTESEFAKIPGFYGATHLLHNSQEKDQYYLFDGPLRLFFGLHLNSTDGGTVFALDLTGPRLVRLSSNWAVPIPLPGEAAFLTLTENRYVPIPGSKKTANCSYIERWNDKLNYIRYARERSAALCYMSMYRPGKNPAVITMRRSSE